MNAILLALALGKPLLPAQADLFTPAQEAAIDAFWQEKGRYMQKDAAPTAPYQVAQSAAGSQWLLHYFKTRDPNAIILPTKNPEPRTKEHVEWDKWITSQYQADHHQAAYQAFIQNQYRKGFNGPWLPISRKPVPASLASLAGEPPRFATIYRPQEYKIQYPDFQWRITDGANVRDLYPYLRSIRGIAYAGESVSQSTLTRLAKEAGLSNKELQVMSAVSQLEGGFGSVNTYDSGYLSVGFIQFASLETGSGSLGRLLSHFKVKSPEGFRKHFSRYGVEVTPDAILVVYDSVQHRELMGDDAVRAVIRNKRLTSVFARAGEMSSTYQALQLQLAKQMYYPAGKSVQITLGGKTHQVQVNDFIRTSQGLAILMDRMVNLGNIGNLQSTVQEFIDRNRLTSLAQLKNSEDLLIGGLVHRDDMVASRAERPGNMAGHLNQSGMISPFDPSGIMGLPSPGEKTGLLVPAKPKTEPAKKPIEEKVEEAAPPVIEKPRDVKKTSGPITDVGG